MVKYKEKGKQTSHSVSIKSEKKIKNCPNFKDSSEPVGVYLVFFSKKFPFVDLFIGSAENHQTFINFMSTITGKQKVNSSAILSFKRNF